MKAYTDLEQSKKLAKILPLESVDMYYINGNTITICKWEDDTHDEDDVPAWSLAALLEILGKWTERVNVAGIAELSYDKELKWSVSLLNCGRIKDCYANNPIDVCYEMLMRLNELNLL